MLLAVSPPSKPAHNPSMLVSIRRPSLISCDAARHGSNRANRTARAKPRSRQLPNGQGWLLDEAAGSHDVVIGQISRQLPNGQGSVVDAANFIITRPRRNPNSIVRRQGAHMQLYGSPAAEAGNLALALSAMQAQTGMVPFGMSDSLADGAVVIDTWAEEVLHDHGSSGSTCLGIVPYRGPSTAQPDNEAEGEWVVETSSSNPRRTKRVKFTCNLCGCTTISPINPHAFAEGSVFARCGGCRIIHKLKDNLQLVFEFKDLLAAGKSGSGAGSKPQPAAPPFTGRVGGVDILAGGARE